MNKCAPKVGIYMPNQPSRTPPTSMVGREQAREIVSQGLATWIDSCRKIRLVRLNESLRDLSSRMGPSVVEACWAGRPWAQQISAEWRGKRHGVNE